MGGNIGTAILALQPPANRPHPRHRDVLVPDRADAEPGADRRHPAQRHAGPPRPARHDGELRRPEGAAGAGGEAPDRRRGRRVVPRYFRALRLANRTWVDIVSADSRVPHGWYANGTGLISRAPWTGPLGPFADLAGIASLRGRHNIQNALAASAAAMLLGVAPERWPPRSRPFRACRIAWRSSAGWAPRSSSTTARPPTPTAPPRRSPHSSAISTGSSAASRSRAGITSLAAFFPRVAKAYLIGEATEEFAATLQGKVAFERCGTLDRAVAAAARDATASGATSPSCCCRPPAPPSTSTAISRCAATPSAPWWRSCPALNCGREPDMTPMLHLREVPSTLIYANSREKISALRRDDVATWHL